MKERRVETREEHEVVREEDVTPRRKVTNVNVGPSGTTNVQESESVEVTSEPVETVDRHEKTVERRIR